MKQKEKWADEACKQIAIEMDYDGFHDYHDGHYKLGWLAGFEFAKKECGKFYILREFAIAHEGGELEFKEVGEEEV